MRVVQALETRLDHATALGLGCQLLRNNAPLGSQCWFSQKPHIRTPETEGWLKAAVRKSRVCNRPGGFRRRC